MLKQLKRKFVLVTMVIILIMLGVLFGLIYSSTKSDMESGRASALKHLEKSVNQGNGIMDLPRDVEYPYFVVYTNDFGEYLAAGYTDYDLNDEALLRSLVSQASNRGTDRGVLSGRQLMFSIGQSRTGKTYIFLDIAGQAATLNTLIRNSVIVGVVGLVAFFGLSILLAKWMVRPVEKAWNQQRQFVSDASHELKTPLTVIMSNAELLQNEQQDKQLTDNILTMSHQMRHLVEGLLDLARADNGQVRKTFARFDLSAVIADSILPFEPVFFEKGLQLRTQIQDGIWINGSQPHIRQVFEILLDNAGKYTETGVIGISLQKRGRQCLLAVSNPGTPIPEEELEKIFERFYRTDKARSRDGSFGLGLAIADTIVKEHKGKIWAVSNPTGNCFFVELPCE